MSEKKDEKKSENPQQQPSTQTNIQLEDLEVQKPEDVKGGAKKTSTYMCPW